MAASPPTRRPKVRKGGAEQQNRHDSCRAAFVNIAVRDETLQKTYES